MTKRIISLILVVFLLFTGSFAVSATVADGTIQPRFKYTSSATVNLSVSNNVAYCTAQLIGNTNVDKIRITITLERRGVLFWNEVDTWTATYYDDDAIMSKTCSVNSGKYRLNADFTVYCGSDTEDISVTSPVKEY